MTGKYILSSYATWLKYVVQETVDYFVAMRIKKKIVYFSFLGVDITHFELNISSYNIYKVFCSFSKTS